MCLEIAASDIAYGSRQLADRPVARHQLAQDRPPGRVGERGEDQVEIGDLRPCPS